MKEANHINGSLSALARVMEQLASRREKHVAFRDSLLTQLLADSLSGQAKCMMFMHVSPESSSYNETVSTLTFGNRVTQVTLGQVCARGTGVCTRQGRGLGGPGLPHALPCAWAHSALHGPSRGSKTQGLWRRVTGCRCPGA